MAALEQVSNLEKGEATPLLRVLEQKQKKYDDAEASTTVSWKGSRTIRTIVVMVVLGIFGLGYSNFSRNSVFTTSTSLGVYNKCSYGSSEPVGGTCQCFYSKLAPIWSSNTAKAGQNCRAIMQKDGNFVIYDDKSKPVWETSTRALKDEHNNDGASIMALQNDGHVEVILIDYKAFADEPVISDSFNPVSDVWHAMFDKTTYHYRHYRVPSGWDTRTVDFSELPRSESPVWSPLDRYSTENGVFPKNGKVLDQIVSEGTDDNFLESGRYMWSENGKFILLMERDCNLVQYSVMCQALK